jgi:hypothetical protein
MTTRPVCDDSMAAEPRSAEAALSMPARAARNRHVIQRSTNWNGSRAWIDGRRGTRRLIAGQSTGIAQSLIVSTPVALLCHKFVPKCHQDD